MKSVARALDNDPRFLEAHTEQKTTAAVQTGRGSGGCRDDQCCKAADAREEAMEVLETGPRRETRHWWSCSRCVHQGRGEMARDGHDLAKCPCDAGSEHMCAEAEQCGVVDGG